MKSNKAIYADSNGKVSEPTDPAITYRVVVAAGGQISDADMKKYGLTPADLGINAEQGYHEAAFDLAVSKPSSAVTLTNTDKPPGDFTALSTQPVAPEVKLGGAVEAKTGLIIEKAAEPEKTVGSKKK